ncbi:MAG: N-6 DNA methylase [Myxococcales bacterium]|nr:N-6 DNA methylase [Myxococcales bacterium]
MKAQVASPDATGSSVPTAAGTAQPRSVADALPAASGDWRWLDLLESSLNGDWDRSSGLCVDGHRAWIPVADDIPIMLGLSMAAQLPERTNRSHARQTLRRSLGSFQTPRAWADALADDAVTTWAAVDIERQPPAIIDPACGAGSLLLALLRRLSMRGYSVVALIRQGMVFGVDIDERAVRACRCALCLLEPDAALRPTDSALQNIQVANALRLENLPSAFGIAVLNPPFINAVEDGVDAALKRWLGVAYPEVGGTANLAGYFLALATRLTAVEGVVSALVPRTSLQARPMRAWRASFTPGPSRARVLRRLRLPGSATLFEGADVFVALLTIGPSGVTQTTSYGDALDPQWQDATARLTHDDWWACLASAAQHEAVDVNPVASRPQAILLLRASLTTADYYRLRGLVVEANDGVIDAPRLMTTGLIDPGESLWGRAPCRFLGTTLQRPVVVDDGTLPVSLARAVAWSRRPKVLIAGLSRELEAVLDRDGRYLGAVSTWSVFDASDDLERLQALVDWLHAPHRQHMFEAFCGASAMSGGSKSVSRPFMERLLADFVAGTE